MYQAIPTTCDGYRFDSKSEAYFYLALRQCYSIKSMTPHPEHGLSHPWDFCVYSLSLNGGHGGKAYIELKPSEPNQEYIDRLVSLWDQDRNIGLITTAIPLLIWGSSYEAPWRNFYNGPVYYKGIDLNLYSSAAYAESAEDLIGVSRHDVEQARRKRFDLV